MLYTFEGSRNTKSLEGQELKDVRGGAENAFLLIKNLLRTETTIWR